MTRHLCAACTALGKRAVSWLRTQTSTAMYCMPFADAEGRIHWHNINHVTLMFECAVGHKWEEPQYATCWCGWTGKPKEKSP